METASIFAGVDITKDPVPVLPTVHYNMGGIPTNYKGEVIYNENKDIVKGLYSIGEAACVSVHGANRLGANSLLDLVVFGRGTGKTITEKFKKEENDEKFTLGIDNKKFNESLNSISELLCDTHENSSVGHIRENMQENMQKYVSVFKTEELLKLGYDKIIDLMKQKVTISDDSEIWNTDLIEALELKNMLALSYITVGASIFREESRGSHYRYDFPERDDKNWMYHTLSWLKDNKVVNKKSDVNFDGLYKDEMETIPPAKRVY